MKLFLRKLLIFIIPIIICFLILEYIIDDSTLVQSSEVYRKVKNYNNLKDEVQLLILGNSHGDNAISDNFQPQIFNLANQGQDLKYDLYLLNLVDNINNVEVIVLTLSYFSFEYSEDKIWPYRIKDYLDVRQLKPSRIYKLKDWIYDHCDLINYNLSFSNVILNHLKKSSRSKFSNNPFSINKDFQNKQDGKGSISDLDLIKDARNRAIRAQKTYFNVPSEIVQGYINEIITICWTLNKEVVAVIPPYHMAYNNNFPVDKLTSFRNRLERIRSRIPVLDYSHDRRFSEDNSLFLNSDHLNRYGATIFTEILKNDLINITGISYVSF